MTLKFSRQKLRFSSDGFTCKVTVRFSKVESGGKWSFIPGSLLDTSRVPADVREQLSFTGRDTTINQENWRTVQQAS